MALKTLKNRKDVTIVKLKIGILILMILCMSSLAGCWNYRELNELALAIGMGVDKVPERNEYRFSFQVVNAEEITGRRGAGRTVPVAVYSSTGNTLFEAIRDASQKVPRRINGQHVRIFIIGEELAKEGIEEVFDLMERDPEPRMTTRVFIAKDSDAETILKTLSMMENIPANSILGKVKVTSEVLGESYEVEIHDVIRGLMTKGGGPVISGVKFDGDAQAGQKKSNMEQTDPPTQLQISGMALFKEGKLVGWVNDREARGLSWINNEMGTSTINLDCEKEKDAIAIEFLRSRTKIKAEFQEEQPLIHINIQQIGLVIEALCPIDLGKSAEIRKLEQQWEKETEDIVMAAVETAQNLKTDILGFGEAVERANPEIWQNIEKDWDNIFATAKVEINVDSTIRSTGQVSKPYLFEMKK
jgi:spore germination protein KC